MAVNVTDSTPVPQELLQRRFDSIDDAVAVMQDQAKGDGYAVKKHRLHRGRDHAVYRQDVPCCKAGKPVATNRQRETGSRKTDCLFMVQVRRVHDDDGQIAWKLVTVNEEHNHILAYHFTTFPPPPQAY